MCFIPYYFILFFCCWIMTANFLMVCVYSHIVFAQIKLNTELIFISSKPIAPYKYYKLKVKRYQMYWSESINDSYLGVLH